MFHPAYSKRRFGQLTELGSVGLDGASRSAKVLYLALPGDPDYNKEASERTTKRRLDSLIEVGDTSLVFAQDVAWSEEITSYS